MTRFGHNTQRPGKGIPLSPGKNFRQFFFRGLGILLPTVLTIWILVAAYGFVQAQIAQPINAGLRKTILWLTPWPMVDEPELAAFEQEMLRDPTRSHAFRAAGSNRQWLQAQARRAELESWWIDYGVVMDLIGLVIAIGLIYIVGLVLGSFIGRRLYLRGERLINRVPLVRRVYPSVKQITDFFVGEHEQRFRFNRVVAVEYPRRGMWSIGLVTGDTIREVQDRAGVACISIFIPSSPTPFTGYVVIIPRQDVLELPLSVEDALKFVISGGVLVPADQGGPSAGSGAGTMVVPDPAT